ncbi:cytochrome P450 734A1-like [Pyrus ussuriensis x Pyrus communis]|uniref:Cytochrome P450 734A1-like n=1 Tax=Pyrus ussuriensis x Pyrus communis TaxID=2448454 RepID=A0A5N5G1S1_9ROSA|nr:cytochrome P450 734A1-like [Pyrus ussuriensis x Pyrus communis]
MPTKCREVKELSDGRESVAKEKMMSLLRKPEITSPIRFLCLLSSLFVLVALIKLFHKIWWIPTRIQKLMALQGIKGPSYRLVHGNTKEISSMKQESMSRPKSFSHDVVSQVHPHIHSWTKTYGNVFLQWYGSQAQLIVKEPELCKEILKNKHGAFVKQKAQGMIKRLSGDGLPRSEGAKWLKMRKLANQAFHGESLKSMTPAIIASAETMLEKWKSREGKEIEVFEEFKLLTSEVIARTAFGSNYLEGKNIFEMLRKLADLIAINHFKLRFPWMSKFFPTRNDIESEKLEKGIRQSIIEIVIKREEQARLTGECGTDFLGLLVKAHHDTDDKRRISEDEVLDECKAFYLAGELTTKTLLAWTVFLLGLHTDWQDIARREVLELFGKQIPNHDALGKLKTMSMIINESLRLYPPIAHNIRNVDRDVTLGKLKVPAGVEVVVPNLALHHDPELWGEDVELFKPDRFSEGVAKATKNNIAAFLPFGMGPRICVGMDLATTQTKIVLSMVLQRYHFTLSPGYVHSPCDKLAICPQHGVQVILLPL